MLCNPHVSPCSRACLPVIIASAIIGGAACSVTRLPRYTWKISSVWHFNRLTIIFADTYANYALHVIEKFTHVRLAEKIFHFERAPLTRSKYIFPLFEILRTRWIHRKITIHADTYKMSISYKIPRCFFKMCISSYIL